MARRLLPGRRGNRSVFGDSAPQPASFPFPKGRFLVLAFALLAVVTMLLIAESRLKEARRLEAVEQEKMAAPPLLEDRDALLAGLFQGTIRDGVNGADFDETPSYDRLIYHVRAMPKAEFTDHVARWLDRTAALEKPDLWRGEFVRVRGLVGKLEAVRLRHPADDVQDIYRGFIDVGKFDGTEIVAFDCVDKPPNVMSERDVVDVEGVFYRTATYEANNGQKVVVPYLIARDVTVLQRAPDELTRFEGWKLGAVIAGSVVLALVLFRLGSRKRRRTAAPPAATPPNFHKTP